MATSGWEIILGTLTMGPVGLIVIYISARNRSNICSMAIGWITIAEHDTSSSRGMSVDMCRFVRAVGQTRWKLWLSVTSIKDAIASISLIRGTRDDSIVQSWLICEFVLELVVIDRASKDSADGDQSQ